MAGKETTCVGLEISDGGYAYLKSTWETSSFSVVVLDGVDAWSRTVSAKEIVSIAASWKIDVGEFMRSARSHLCRQHPTSEYSISAGKDADVVQLSFTIDDLLEGEEGKETLNFDLRLTRVSDVGAVVRDLLNHLLDTKNKLETQLAEAEHRVQKKLHASEPEPSITLSIARPNANPRRQSSLLEPRLLDFTKRNRPEEVDTTRSACTLTRAPDHLQHDTPKAPSRLPFDQLVSSTVKTEREPASSLKTLPISFRDNDLTLRAREAYLGFDIPLSPTIMRVLNNISGSGAIHHRDFGHGGDVDDRGVKITEVRSREEQPQRSFVVEKTPVSTDLSSSTYGRRTFKVHEEDTTPAKRNAGVQEDIAHQKSDAVFEKKTLQDVDGVILEKGSSNAGESGRGLEKSAQGEAKEASDEEPTSRATLPDVHLISDPSSRAKAGSSEKPRNEWPNEDQEQQKLADKESRGAESPKHSVQKRSMESLWSNDVIVPLTTRKSLVTPEYEKGSCSHQGRKRTLEDRDGGLEPVKLEVEGKREVVDLEELFPEEVAGEYKKRDTIQVLDAPPGFARPTIADLLRQTPAVGGEGTSRGRGRDRRRMVRPPQAARERRLRRRPHDDRSPSDEAHVLDPDELAVPDPDYYNFDEERTEDLISPNQIWAVYDERDGFPRVWARIEKVVRQPKFEVLVTWLTPCSPSADAETWFETSGFPASCGKFQHGNEAILGSINMFSHRMKFEWVARDVVAIYPKRGEVWALYTSGTVKSAATDPKRPRFRVVHILEDVQPEKRPLFSVLKRVKGFRTVYRASHEPGTIAFSYLVLFSHRVLAHQLQGTEGPTAASLKGSWDVDPAGLPSTDRES